LTDGSTGTVFGQARIKDGQILPSFGTSLTYQLFKHVNAKMSVSVGSEAYMKTSVQFDYLNYQASLGATLNPKNTHFTVKTRAYIAKMDLNVVSNIQYGFLGLIFNYGISKKITEFSRIGTSVVYGSNVGIYVNLNFERGGQSFVVPIRLTNEFLPSAFIYGSLVPTGIYLVVKRLLIEPYLKNKLEKDAKDKQEKLRNEIREKRREAMAAQELMSETYARCIEREGPNGIIIEKAFYGKFDMDVVRLRDATIDEIDKAIDVKIPLQILVKDRSLVLMPDSIKNDLQGFCDPCVGEPKSLYVHYSYNYQTHEALFGENDLVRLPNKSHVTIDND